MGFEKGNPFEKLVLGDPISFAELFNGVKTCKVFPEDAQDKEQTVAGVRDDDIRKDGMCMVAAVTEDPEDAEILMKFLCEISCITVSFSYHNSCITIRSDCLYDRQPFIGA